MFVTELVVSELVTNALRYGEGEIRLRLLRDRTLVCEVWDAGLVELVETDHRICDEISLGLAPIVVHEVYARLPSIVAEGSSLVIVEQDIVQALKTARHVYCLQEGRVALQGEAKTLTREKISAAYFGV